MNYFLLYIVNNSLTFVLITIFVECFSAIFKKLTHLLYKQKGPCKAERNVYLEKNVPPKRDPGFMEVGSLLGGRINTHIIHRLRFFNKILL